MPINSHAVEVAFFLATASVAWSAAFAWARWLARPRDNVLAEPEYQGYLAKRIANVEQAVNAIGGELQRLAEGQRFTERLLAERLPAADLQLRPPDEPRRVNTPH
jgi:hypothetical protein